MVSSSLVPGSVVTWTASPKEPLPGSVLSLLVSVVDDEPARAPSTRFGFAPMPQPDRVISSATDNGAISLFNFPHTKIIRIDSNASTIPQSSERNNQNGKCSRVQFN